MNINPFDEKPLRTKNEFMDWKKLAPKPYNKFEVDPYTKVRIILACGAEYEAVWFGHQFHRHCPDNDVYPLEACKRIGMRFDNFHHFTDLALIDNTNQHRFVGVGIHTVHLHFRHTVLQSTHQLLG